MRVKRYNGPCDGDLSNPGQTGAGIGRKSRSLWEISGAEGARKIQVRKGFGANFPRDFMAGIREKIRVPKSPEQPGLIVIAEAFNGYLLARYRASPGSQGLPKIPCRTFSCGLFAAIGARPGRGNPSQTCPSSVRPPD